MKIRCKLDISPEKIAAAHGLGANGRLQLALGREVMRRCDKYVPYDTGRLKGSARLSPGGRTLSYSAPYAAAQYYLPYRHSNPLRGRFWEKRMLAAEKTALLSALKSTTGGHSP